MSEPVENVSIAKMEERALADWAAELGSFGAFKIKVVREEPKVWRGRKVSGHLTTLEGEFVDEEGARERWGGGKFKFTALKQDQRGRWVYAAHRTFEVVGDPKISGELFDDHGVEPTKVEAEETSLSKRALDLTSQIAHEERQRADKLSEEARSANKFDPTMMKMMMEPLALQLQMMQENMKVLQVQLGVKDDKITELITKKPDATVQDRILEKMVDGESARIDSLRAQHDSELRQLRESHRDDLKRMQDHYLMESQNKERGHTREIDTIRSAHQAQVDGMKLAYDARIDGLQAQIRTLERDLDATKKELVELRAKKEVPLEEQLTKMVQLKEAFEALGGGDSEGGIAEQIIDKVSPLVEGIGQRIADGPGGAAARQQAQAQQQAMMRPKAPSVPTIQIPMSEGEWKQAITFIESAFANDTPPEVFATTIRNMRPDLVNFLKEHGVDRFLSLVRPSEDTSLGTQAGKNFLRKVAKLLVEET